MQKPVPAGRSQSAQRRRLSRLEAAQRTGRRRMGPGLQYWQVGGSTRAAVKRVKQG